MKHITPTGGDSSRKVSGRPFPKEEKDEYVGTSLMDLYDQFSKECTEQQFTPTYQLFKLWLEVQRHNAAERKRAERTTNRKSNEHPCS